jgi:hypothetical protein
LPCARKHLTFLNLSKNDSLEKLHAPQGAKIILGWQVTGTTEALPSKPVFILPKRPPSASLLKKSFYCWTSAAVAHADKQNFEFSFVHLVFFKVAAV